MMNSTVFVGFQSDKAGGGAIRPGAAKLPASKAAPTEALDEPRPLPYSGVLVVGSLGTCIRSSNAASPPLLRLTDSVGS
jgi:hypothetical protein